MVIMVARQQPKDISKINIFQGDTVSSVNRQNTGDAAVIQEGCIVLAEALVFECFEV